MVGWNMGRYIICLGRYIIWWVVKWNIFVMKLCNIVGDRGLEVIYGKYCIKRFYVFFVSIFCIIW